MSSNLTATSPSTATAADFYGGLAFVLLWSTGYISAGYGLQGAGPLTLAVVRFGGTALLVGLLLRLRAPRLKVRRSALVHAAVAGVMLQAGFFGFIYAGMKAGVPAAPAGLISGLMPLMTAIGAALFLGERLRRNALVGLALGLVGVLLVVGPDLRGDGPVLGYVFVVLALIALSGGTLYQKRHAGEMDARLALVVQVGASLLLLLPFAWMFEGLRVDPEPAALAGMAWMILVNSCAGLMLYLWLLGRGAAGRVAGLFYLVPPVTAGLAALLLGARFTALDGAGFAVAALGVWIGQRAER